MIDGSGSTRPLFPAGTLVCVICRKLLADAYVDAAAITVRHSYSSETSSMYVFRDRALCCRSVCNRDALYAGHEPPVPTSFW